MLQDKIDPPEHHRPAKGLQILLLSRRKNYAAPREVAKHFFGPDAPENPAQLYDCAISMAARVSFMIEKGATVVALRVIETRTRSFFEVRLEDETLLCESDPQNLQDLENLFAALAALFCKAVLRQKLRVVENEPRMPRVVAVPRTALAS